MTNNDELLVELLVELANKLYGERKLRKEQYKEIKSLHRRFMWEHNNSISGTPSGVYFECIRWEQTLPKEQYRAGRYPTYRKKRVTKKTR